MKREVKETKEICVVPLLEDPSPQWTGVGRQREDQDN